MCVDQLGYARNANVDSIQKSFFKKNVFIKRKRSEPHVWENFIGQYGLEDDGEDRHDQSAHHKAFEAKAQA